MAEKKILLLSIITLLFLGLLNILSSSAAWAYMRTGDVFEVTFKHIIYLFLSLTLLIICYFLGIGFLKKFSRIALLTSIMLLATILIPGIRQEVNFSKRWIDLVYFTFQPSNVALSGYIIYSVYFFTNLGKNINQLIRYIPHMLITLIFAVLIYLEPDFSSMVILVGIGFLIYILAGTPWKYIAYMLLPIAIIFFVLSVSQPYRMERIFSFINPEKHASYQVTQSLEAIKAGGILGQGIGNGKARLLYLPYSFSDFSFSVILEESGFFGGLLVLITLMAILYSGLRIATNSKDPFSILYCTIVTLKLCIYAVVHSGVSLSLLPATGLPFPFLSYGGTFLFLTMAEMGFVLSTKRSKA